ncbi:hypothetical protein [Methylocystis echinoides]|uniref:hypothetical protein n=1 Tax=Methylocystis echinoides TaxID=29468 RepID=UPI002492DA05|nr:hypothetical protein [Methylocystis echinoides]
MANLVCPFFPGGGAAGGDGARQDADFIDFTANIHLEITKNVDMVKGVVMANGF